MKQSNAGFTLIELMIVVAIIGILAGISTPMYFSYIEKTNRKDAMGALLAMEQAQESYFLQNGTYATNTDIAKVGGALSPDGYYSLAITAANAVSFTAVATPVVGGPQAQDSDCATFTVQSNGLRTATGAASANCW